MKFYIYEGDFRLAASVQRGKRLTLRESTSVIAYKRWFFHCLNKLGRIIALPESVHKNRLKWLLAKPDAIFVKVNARMGTETWEGIAHRLLTLSLGGSLSLEGLDRIRTLPTAQVSVVSTLREKDLTAAALGDLAPRMNVFAPRIATGFFTIPDKMERQRAREEEGIGEDQVHIVYAGRWVVAKGICQLIRCLDLWPIPHVVLTLAGNIEERNKLPFSFANHATFSLFLNDEILHGASRPWLRLRPAKNKRELRACFWSADLFVNPSVQPDENYGITPREALACGVPVVTTNFCGLYPLAHMMPWQGIDTYPTLAGSRFSLRQLNNTLCRAVADRTFFSAEESCKAIARESDPAVALESLRESIDYLSQRAPETPLNHEEAKRKIKRRLFETADPALLHYFIEMQKESPRRGALVYGDVPVHSSFLLTQGLFSTLPARPHVEINSAWRGFFRVTLWKKESALVEFGFPGPRIVRYPIPMFNSLTQCARLEKSGEITFAPKNSIHAGLVQGLVDLGYLVPDK